MSCAGLGVAGLLLAVQGCIGEEAKLQGDMPALRKLLFDKVCVLTAYLKGHNPTVEYVAGGRSGQGRTRSALRSTPGGWTRDSTMGSRAL